MELVFKITVSNNDPSQSLFCLRLLLCLIPNWLEPKQQNSAKHFHKTHFSRFSVRCKHTEYMSLGRWLRFCSWCMVSSPSLHRLGSEARVMKPFTTHLHPALRESSSHRVLQAHPQSKWESITLLGQNTIQTLNSTFVKQIAPSGLHQHKKTSSFVNLDRHQGS